MLQKRNSGSQKFHTASGSVKPLAASKIIAHINQSSSTNLINPYQAESQKQLFLNNQGFLVNDHLNNTMQGRNGPHLSRTVASHLQNECAYSEGEALVAAVAVDSATDEEDFATWSNE